MCLVHCYLVYLVVILGIVLENFGFLRVVEVPHELIDAKGFPPFLAINKPECLSEDYHLRRDATTYICFARLTLNFLARKKRS